MSAVVDRWGWRARIGLPPGQTATDLINSTPALESGLRTRPGAVRVEPDPDRADHVVVRVLTTDPHTQPLPYPTADRGHRQDRHRPDPARPVRGRRTRHACGSRTATACSAGSPAPARAASSTSSSPNSSPALTSCSGASTSRAAWSCARGRPASTGSPPHPEEAAALLADAVAVLEARARRLAADGSRLWLPTAAAPALIVVIDEYAELTDESATATGHADSIARRGRATAVTLLVATQRPTQKAMGSGAVRSQMDVRICLRVRERRDVDLILGQGMLTAGWAADTLNAPGKFLISTPEHTTPRRARAYRVTDHDVATIAARHADGRPQLDARVHAGRRPAGRPRSISTT